MNEHPPLEPVGDASLEARIVAWVLGEASAFEAGELERLCDERPELLVFRRRMRALHGLLSEAESAEPDDAWKLPSDKRAKIEELFGESTPEPEIPVLRPVAPRRWLLKTILTAAACVMFGMLYRFGFEERSTMRVAAKSVDFMPRATANENGRLSGRVEITAGSAFEVAPQSPDAQSRAWYGRSDENGVAGNGIDEIKDEVRYKVYKSEFDRSSRSAAGADFSYKAKAAQAVAESESLASASKLEVIREFNYPTEYEPPELPNSVGNALALGDKAKASPATPAKGGEAESSPTGRLKTELRLGSDRQYPLKSDVADATIPPSNEAAAQQARQAFGVPQATTMSPWSGATQIERYRYASGDSLAVDGHLTQPDELTFKERAIDPSGGISSRRPPPEPAVGGMLFYRQQFPNLYSDPPSPAPAMGDSDGEVDPFAPSQDKGAKLAARPPVSEAKPGEPTGDLAFAAGSDSSILRSEPGQEIQGEFQTKDRVIRREVPVTPATPTAGLKKGLAAADQDTTVDAEFMDRSGRARGFIGGGSGGGQAENAPMDEISSLGLAKKKEDALAYDAGLVSDFKITGSTAVTGKSELGEMEGAKTQVADGTLVVGGTIVNGGRRSEASVIDRNSIDALLTNPSPAQSGTRASQLTGGSIQPEGGALAKRESEARDIPAGSPAPAPSAVAAPAKPASANAKELGDSLGRAEPESRRLVPEDTVAGQKTDASKSIAAEPETVMAQHDMASERLEKVKILSSEKKGEAINTAVDAQDYIDARRELDTAQEMLNTMKLKLLGETIQERIPSSSIVVHEEPVIEKPGWLSLDRRYQSSTAVQVKPRTPGVTVLGRENTGSSGQEPTSPQFFANEFEIVKSTNVLMKVAEQLELSNKWEIPKEKVVEELQKSITVSNRPGTDLIDIKVKNEKAEDSRDIVAEVAKAYKNYRTEIENRDSEAALLALRKAVRDQEDKVEERRKLVTTIVRTKGIIPTGEDNLLSNDSKDDGHTINPAEYEERFRQTKQRILDLKADLATAALSGKPRTEVEKQLRDETDNAEDLRKLLDTIRRARNLSPKPAPTPAPIPTDEISASGEAFSTFSLHVSDASFKVAKAALDRGERPDPESVRPEEFYNAFDYGDPTPAPGEPVACAIEQAALPILPQRNLVRVAMRTGAAGRAASQPLNLTVLLDHSGSMEREDRHEGLNQAIVQLASLLKAGDTITVAGFSRTPRLMADRLPGERAKELIDIVRNTPSEGGTNLEEALKLGGDLALRQKNPAAQNRIVLLTDGAANLGNAKPEDLAERIRALRQQGISFDAAGLGAGGVNDRMLETLTRDGNGRYYLIDQPSDADANFAKQLAGAFRPAAENVKVQVHFNPARVGRYKLIGFEKHRLKTEDFRNDKVDAAELAAEEAGVALYQVETLPQGTGEIGEASVRFKDTSTGQMVEQTWTIAYDEKAPAFDQATPSMQLATLAALSAEKLRGGPLAEAIDFQSLTPQVAKVRAHYATSKKVGDLIEMIGKLK